MILVKDILRTIDEAVPFSTQCAWDNSGFLVGDENQAVETVGFALDLTPETLQAAKDAGAQLIVTHHPVIFHAQKHLREGNVIYALVRSGIAAISSHTPWDCAPGGVNDVLGTLLGLQDLTPVESKEAPQPMARIGTVEPCTGAELAQRVAAALQTTVRLADAGRPITRVAVCGGAAIEILDEAVAAGADAFVTGDLKHHEALDALERGVTVIAAGHFETENPSVAALKATVEAAFPSLRTVLLPQENPIKFVAPKG